MKSSEKLSTEPFPNHPGTYALILSLSGRQTIRIGKLGNFDFPAGYYIYVGSAFGSGGLAGRLNRHVRLAQDDQGEKRLHWHIDHLRQVTRLEEIWYAVHDESCEHIWASLVGRLPGATVPAPRFGASDCRCRSHLFHFLNPPNWADFQGLLNDALPAGGPANAQQHITNLQVAAIDTIDDKPPKHNCDKIMEEIKIHSGS